jgi:hypothetical protein
MSWAVVVVQALLFGDAKPPACAQDQLQDQIACLLDARFAKDDRAKAVALELFHTTGEVAALGAE